MRDAVKGRLEAGRDMDLHYDHPILMLQHMLWHEGYHHGQIKLALKQAGPPLIDDEAGAGDVGRLDGQGELVPPRPRKDAMTSLTRVVLAVVAVACLSGAALAGAGTAGRRRRAHRVPAAATPRRWPGPRRCIAPAP